MNEDGKRINTHKIKGTGCEKTQDSITSNADFTDVCFDSIYSDWGLIEGSSYVGALSCVVTMKTESVDVTMANDDGKRLAVHSTQPL